MAGKHSRNKGAQGERNVLEWLRPVVDRVYGTGAVELRRNSNHGTQKESRGDCTGLWWLSLEVKFYKSLTHGQVEAFWRQCLAQTRPSQLPVLVYGVNRQPWKVRTRVGIAGGRVQAVVDMDLPTFLEFFELMCKEVPCDQTKR